MNDLGGWIFLTACLVCFFLWAWDADKSNAHESTPIGKQLIVSVSGKQIEICDPVISLIWDGGHILVTCLEVSPTLNVPEGTL